MELTEEVAGKLDSFDFVLLLKALRPDKLLVGIEFFINEKLGHKFIETPVWKLENIFEDSDCTTPLIFILSVGSDPKS